MEVSNELTQLRDARGFLRILLLDRLQQGMNATYVTNGQKLPQVFGLLPVQFNLGRGNFSANLSRTTGVTPDTTVSVFYILPLDARRNTSTQFRYDSDSPSPNAADDA